MASPKGVGTSSPQATFDEARAAQLRGDLAAAEDGYRAVIEESDGQPASSAADPLYRARWNLATIYEGRDQLDDAVRTLEPPRNSRTNALNPDPELHLRRAQLSLKLFDQRVAKNELGSALPTVVENRIVYEPAPLEALRVGVRAYLDLRESLALPGARAAIGEEQARSFETEADVGIAHAAIARAAFAGKVQEAAVGRIMTADRDAMAARLRARGKEVPEQMLGRLGITEGPLADAMAERTAALYAGARAAGLDNTEYTFAWSQWLISQRPGGQ